MEASEHHIVIGADGAAFATARAATERGYRATVLIQRGVPTASRIPPGLRVRDLDMRDRGAIALHTQGAQTIYYCAGTATLPIDEDEPDRVSAVVNAAAKTGARLVYCDAPYAYGVTSGPVSEDMPYRARDPFGTFLAALSSHVLNAHRQGRIKAVIARHADLVGPDVVRSPFGEGFVNGLMRGRAQPVPGRPDAPRSLTYAPDLGRAAVLLAEQRDAWGQIWHVPSILPVSPRTLADKVQVAAGLRPLATPVIRGGPARSALGVLIGERPCAERGLAKYHESEFRFLTVKFERAFGLHATSLADVLAETVAAHHLRAA